MATVTSTINMFTPMASQVKNVTYGMKSMYSVMNQLQSSINKSIKLEKVLTYVKQKRVSDEIKLRKAFEKSTIALDEFTYAASEGARTFTNIINDLKGLKPGAVNQRRYKEESMITSKPGFVSKKDEAKNDSKPQTKKASSSSSKGKSSNPAKSQITEMEISRSVIQSTKEHFDTNSVVKKGAITFPSINDNFVNMGTYFNNQLADKATYYLPEQDNTRLLIGDGNHDTDKTENKSIANTSEYNYPVLSNIHTPSKYVFRPKIKANGSDSAGQFAEQKVIPFYRNPLNNLFALFKRERVRQSSGKSNVFKENTNIKLKNSVSDGSEGKTKGGSMLKGVFGAEQIINTAKKGMEMSDNLIMTQTKLGQINDGKQSTSQLQDKVFASAQRSGGDYGTMAGNVTRLGLMAGNSFKSNNEIIGFTELIQKSYKASGATQSDQKTGTNTMIGAMAGGKLQGDDFKSIMENAPIIADAIAQFTGKSKNELMEMATSGALSADIIKGAMFSAADNINDKFRNTPKTFSDVMSNLQGVAVQGLTPILEKMSELLNSPEGMAFINNISTVISFITGAISNLIIALTGIGDFISSNWSIIEPILIAIGSALALWATVQFPMLIVKLWGMVTPILAQAGAWLLANWPILLIGAAIGLLIYAVLKWGDTVSNVIGFVGGIIGVLCASIYNAIASTRNAFSSIVEFITNAINSLKILFMDFVINALSNIRKLVGGLGEIKIPGFKINVTSGIDNLLKDAEAVRDKLNNNKDAVKYDKLEKMDYGDAFNKGREVGKSVGNFMVDGAQELADKISNTFNGKKKPQDEISLPPENYTPYIDKVGEVGKINESVDVSSEDLTTMRELAEMKNIQNFVSLTPTVKVQTGDINNGYDVNTIISRITTALENEITSTAEGVYA